MIADWAVCANWKEGEMRGGVNNYYFIFWNMNVNIIFNMHLEANRK